MLIIEFSGHLHHFLFILQTSLPLLADLFRSLNKKKLKKNVQYQHTHGANNLTLQEFKASARIVRGTIQTSWSGCILATMPHCSNYTGPLNHAPVSLLVNTNQIYLKYLLYKIIVF